MDEAKAARTPGQKLLFAILIGLALAIPLFSVWLLVYDRQSQSNEASRTITEGWGGPQVISGPVLVIPYKTMSEEAIGEGDRKIVTRREVWREITLQPEIAQYFDPVDPEIRSVRSTRLSSTPRTQRRDASFTIPVDLNRFGVTARQMDLTRAEIRFGLSDPRGLGANPRVGHRWRQRTAPTGRRKRPGQGILRLHRCVRACSTKPIGVTFDYQFRGNKSLSLAPMAGDTRWQVQSTWASPSFVGSFLPTTHQVTDKGFKADYAVGNLALGKSLLSTADKGNRRFRRAPVRAGNYDASVETARRTELAGNQFHPARRPIFAG